jgi:hypothetical protein
VGWHDSQVIVQHASELVQGDESAAIGIEIPAGVIDLLVAVTYDPIDLAYHVIICAQLGGFLYLIP